MFENSNVGIDIVYINRFKDLPYDSNKKFYEKIFNKSEINYCIKFKNPYPHFAARFAVKEALVKSIHTKIDLKDIEIIQKNSKPMIKSSKKMQYTFNLSLSHDGDYAIAIVISKKSNNSTTKHT